MNPSEMNPSEIHPIYYRSTKASVTSETGERVHLLHPKLRDAEGEFLLRGLCERVRIGSR